VKNYNIKWCNNFPLYIFCVIIYVIIFRVLSFMLSFEVIIWCYHLLLSFPPFFLFPENLTHSKDSPNLFSCHAEWCHQISAHHLCCAFAAILWTLHLVNAVQINSNFTFPKVVSDKHGVGNVFDSNFIQRKRCILDKFESVSSNVRELFEDYIPDLKKLCIPSFFVGKSSGQSNWSCHSVLQSPSRSDSASSSK
jgi:hypothetical protein